MGLFSRPAIGQDLQGHIAKGKLGHLPSLFQSIYASTPPTPRDERWLLCRERSPSILSIREVSTLVTSGLRDELHPRPIHPGRGIVRRRSPADEHVGMRG